MRKRKKKSFEIWQGHHITYEPELIVLITRTEHFFSGRLQPYFKARGISKGMKELFKWCIKNYRTNPVPKEVKQRIANDKNRDSKRRAEEKGL